MKRAILASIFSIVLLSLATNSQAETSVTVEGDLTWQSRNDQRVPGNSGTDFSLVDFAKGPFAGYRIYVGHLFNGRHEIRGLYAPLSITANGRFSSPILYQGSTFAAGTDTEAFYKFNSYRLTYAYHFDPVDAWKFAVGFTGKIRDAEVRLTQGALTQSKSNVGLVPLLNLQAVYAFDGTWNFRFDMDGLAAPQGRAFDIALLAEYVLNPDFKFRGGYRTVEGGADNSEVYNFAWIHKLVLGGEYSF